MRCDPTGERLLHAGDPEVRLKSANGSIGTVASLRPAFLLSLWPRRRRTRAGDVTPGLVPAVLTVSRPGLVRSTRKRAVRGCPSTLPSTTAYHRGFPLGQNGRTTSASCEPSFAATREDPWLRVGRPVDDRQTSTAPALAWLPGGATTNHRDCSHARSSRLAGSEMTVGSNLFRRQQFLLEDRPDSAPNKRLRGQ